MNLEISSLSNGLTIVTDPMAGLESAALGCGSAPVRATKAPPKWASPTCSNIWRSKAPRRAAPARSPKRSKRWRLSQRLHQPGTNDLSRPGAQSRCGAGLELIADILTAPTYDQAELERERQVVLQELGQARDTPDDIIFDHLQSVIYRGQALGWSILARRRRYRLSNRRSARLCRRALSRPGDNPGFFRRGLA